MASILYGVPYEMRVLAHDTASGRRSGCRHYYVTAVQSDTPPPAYGAAIAGGGSDATLLSSFKSKWDALIGSIAHTSYQMDSIEMRTIIGKRYGTPLLAITAITATLTETRVTTATPHGLVVGDTVVISGVTTPAGMNTSFLVSSIINPTTFSFVPPFPGAYTGLGLVQRIHGNWTWLYGTKLVTADTSAGLVAGEAYALFADLSIVRNNVGVGKSFRSRFSVAPLSESQVLAGVLIGAATTSIAAALLTFSGTLSNGGTDSTGGVSVPVAVSQKLAFATASPFTTNSSWVAQVTSMRCHQNLGSQVKRKIRILG